MTHGLTLTGFVPKTTDEILSELAADQRASPALSPLWASDQISIIGAINATVASQLGAGWEGLQGVYNQFDRQAAEGVSLDSVGNLTGTMRLPRRRTTIRNVQCTLDPATEVAAESLIASIAGDPSRKFRNSFGFNTGGVSGTGSVVVDVQFEALEYGPIEAPAGFLTTRESSVAGWSAVTNPIAGDLGADVETDAAYKLRQAEDLASPGSSSQPGLLSALRDVPGVTSVSILGNDTDGTVDAVPPHSFEAIIEGGDNDAIAAKIFAEKAPGDGTSGSVTRVVTSEDGIGFSIRFTRPADINFYIAISVRVNSDYPGSTALKDALAAWANVFHTPGTDVSPSRIAAKAFETPGVYDVPVCTAGISHPGGAAIVPVDVRSRAKFAAVRITVTVL
jgi:uncharacterized phage protein gp47/JayE